MLLGWAHPQAPRVRHHRAPWPDHQAGLPAGPRAAIEAVQRAPQHTTMRRTYDRIVDRRGGTSKNIAKVAAARKLLTLVYYGLRDGHIRCLDAPAT